MLIPFILSQIGESQNELVYCGAPIDKFELSSHLYLVSGKLADKSSFLRCFRMRNEVVLAYYWKTNYTEVKSNRKGLFIIIGFLINNALLNNIPPIISYCEQFLTALKNIFGFSFEDPFSDVFFSQIQNRMDEKFHQLPPSYFSNKKMRHTGFLFNNFFRKITSPLPQALYCLNTSGFFMHWITFSYETLSYLKRGYQDISSIADTSASFFLMLNEGDFFPLHIKAITLKHYQQYSYLLVF